MSETVKIRFGNDHTEDGETYELGGVYEVPVATARHFVRVGKAQRVAPNTKTTEDRAAEERGKSATVSKDSGKTAAKTEDGGKTAAASEK